MQVGGLQNQTSCLESETASYTSARMALIIREFPKIRGTLFWGPYNKDPTI